MKNNITLIGMPGSGKSTVGVVLAKRLGRRFVDSDLVIQDRHGKLLHELITEYGVEGFWQIERRECVLKSGEQHHCYRRKCLLRAGRHAASAGDQYSGIPEASL